MSWVTDANVIFVSQILCQNMYLCLSFIRHKMKQVILSEKQQIHFLKYYSLSAIVTARITAP